MTQFQEWLDKYEEFLEQTEDHMRVLSELISELGGDPMYVSPPARMAEFQATKLMEAVLLAEWKDQANWKALSALADRLPDSESSQAIRRAVEQVEAQEDDHVRWAQQSWGKALLGQITAGGQRPFHK
jgi:rubrerythrin